MEMHNFILLMLAVVLSTVVASSKYSATVNNQEANNHRDETRFKSKKAMMIWMKARKKLDGKTVELDALYGELLVIDKELLNLKTLKFDKKDPYGEAENAIEEKIDALLKKYYLYGNNAANNIRSNRVQDQIKKPDKFEAMYNKAEKLGFNDEELQELKVEIFHHKRKMDELNLLVGNLNELQEKHRMDSNAVDKKTGNQVPREIKEMKETIKDMEQELTAGMTRLHLISDTPGMASDQSFKQQKILKLWADILQSNFTQEERDSLKEELLHLERKMDKRDKLNEEKSLLAKHAESLKDDSDSRKEKYLAKHEKVVEKTETLDKHVGKYFRDLNSRIAERQHVEL